ncbi:MAG: hypothetical protein HKN36_10120 [Hellea sp.]|nr:hypothetical protein [Hellea sp.]
MSVALGILASWVASALFIGAYYHHVPSPAGLPVFKSWAASLAVPLLSLIIGIGLAARHRFFDSRMDGSAPDKGDPLDIILRYNQNTMEQLVIFAGAAALALALMPETAARLLPGMSLWFGVMRLAFYLGYKKSPTLRAFGFAGTFHPTLLLFFAALGSLIASHG